jgi:16S rRNA (cytidine1402-2'-O)-methyltransferase
MESGTLFVVATPIGNLADITLRALDTLRSVNLIAAEDTRHTRKLLSHYDIHKPMVSYHNHNMKERGPHLVGRLQAGENIAVVTDAGSPGVSDPGTLLVQEALEADIPVVCIPGPSAAITALVASGLPTHPFAFLGFPPNRGTGRKRFFASYAKLPMSLILFESPQRLLQTLKDISNSWGSRKVAVARELTKMHEEMFRGTVEEAQAHFSEGVRGEVTLVVAGAEEDETATVTGENSLEWKEELQDLLYQQNLTVKDATEQIVQRRRLPRRAVYQAALALRGSNIE